MPYTNYSYAAPLAPITHLSHLSHLSHQPYSPTLAIKAQKKKSQKAYCPLRLLYIRYRPLRKWYDVGEAHKCHGEQARSDKGNRHTTHALRNLLDL